MGQLLLCTIIGLAPWILVQSLGHLWLQTNPTSHQPRFGLPFSGFRNLGDAGLVRSAYILCAVGFMIVSTAWMVLTAVRMKGANLLVNSAAAFATIFLLFHLCLKTLHYIDRDVWTFDYQDRYFVPLWPLAVLAWGRWLSRPVVGGMVMVSMAISAYWLRNYIMVSGLDQL